MFKGPVARRSIERIRIKGRLVQGEMTLERVRTGQITQSFVGLVKTFKLSSRSAARRIMCSYLYFEMAAPWKWN